MQQETLELKRRWEAVQAKIAVQAAIKAQATPEDQDSSIGIPEDLRCSVSSELMLAPVIANDDAYYDRSVAEKMVASFALKEKGTRGVRGKDVTDFKPDDERLLTLRAFIAEQEKRLSIEAPKPVAMEKVKVLQAAACLSGPVTEESKAAFFRFCLSHGFYDNVRHGAVATGLPVALVPGALEMGLTGGGKKGGGPPAFATCIFVIAAIPGVVLGGMTAPLKALFLQDTRKARFESANVVLVFNGLKGMLLKDGQEPGLGLPDDEDAAEASKPKLPQLSEYNEEFIALNYEALEAWFADIVRAYKPGFGTSTQSFALYDLLSNPCVSVHEKLWRVTNYMLHREEGSEHYYNLNKKLFNAVCRTLVKANLQLTDGQAATLDASLTAAPQRGSDDGLSDGPSASSVAGGKGMQ